MFCVQCGKNIPDDSKFCMFCGASSQQSIKVVGDRLIPANSMALISYYTGIISLLLGILGIIAVVTGVKGIEYANKNPDAGGKIHAWVGIICGSVSFVVFLILLSLLTV